MINVEICKTFSCCSPFQLGPDLSSSATFRPRSNDFRSIFAERILIKTDLCKLRFGPRPRRRFVVPRYRVYFRSVRGCVIVVYATVGTSSGGQMNGYIIQQ
jgi:hypothetical protein